jgi:thiamine biosynthesis protein ThiS
MTLMNIFINGEQKTVSPGISIARILETHKILPASIVVELNEAILQPGMFADSYLTDGDRIEFIRFVGGG